MTEFISRNYDKEGYEIIIKTDSYEHYRAAVDFARRLIDHSKSKANADLADAPTVDAVPVSELKKLRDYLYAEDLIFMSGLAELNKLIANCGQAIDWEV